MSVEDKAATFDVYDKYYEKYDDCRRAVYRLGILGLTQYNARRGEDLQLPPNPAIIYKEFKGWKDFCAQVEVYRTIDECKAAARALSITGKRDYVRRRRENPLLPQNPEEKYSSEFKGWEEFLGFGGEPYETYFESSKAAVRLGCTTRTNYHVKRKQDPRLVGNPMAYYIKDWKSWDHYLQRSEEGVNYASGLDSVQELQTIRPSSGTRTRDPKARIRPGLVSVEFMSYNEAKMLISELGVKSRIEYKTILKEHTSLPPAPETYYGEAFISWNDIFSLAEPYDNYEDCRRATQALGITGWKNYSARRHEDPRLPLDPKLFEEFLSWESFLGFGDIPYASYQEASDAAKRLGISSRDIYSRRRHKDPRLVASPLRQYPDEWSGWPKFLQAPVQRKKRSWDKLKDYYSTYEQFEAAAIKLGVRTQLEYRLRYVEDPFLPKYPEKVYAEHWVGWKRAVTGRVIGLPSTWQEAKKLHLPYRFSSATEYMDGYKINNKLPSNPQHMYKDFPGWKIFLLPDKYLCLDDVRLAAKVLKLKNKDDYDLACVTYLGLPKCPEVDFSTDWVNWYDLAGQVTPYTYEELQQIVRANGCKTIGQVRKLISKLQDPRIPYKLELFYKESWSNSFDFLGTELPYSLKYVTKESAGWVEDIKLFLDNNLVKGRYEQLLCRFLRHYIEPNQYARNVVEFLLLGRVNTNLYEEFLVGHGTVTGNAVRYAVNNYLEDALKRNFTEEDEDGRIYRVPGASNPLAAIEHLGSTSSPSESVKPVLAYQFVEGVRNWIVPKGASTFGDLKALHNFDADYYPVEESRLDFNDPNCVYRKSGSQYYLWFPVHWMALYALVSVPARGRQIMYNDSGEADEYIPELLDGEVYWVRNHSDMAKCGRQEGFVSRDVDGNWGMHFTSNKTSYEGAGYDVAWIPSALVYWLTVLREWQQKYNQILNPTPWTNCAKRCNLTEKQLKKKGDNCFLFRGFDEQQPPSFTSPMTTRLAAALYYSQPCDLELAIFEGDASNNLTTPRLSRYKTEFTPHSMRVSLITAYVMDFGMDPAVIMKIVGHASIVMTIYYVKIGGARMRHLMAEGEKRAQLNQARDVQLMIEQKRLDEMKPMFVSNNQEALDALLSGRTGTQLVRDYGICPYAGTRCEDGGQHHVKSWLPVSAGHLGIQNCPRCRHFVTGPVFLGGLTALWNEISLCVNLQWDQYSDMEKQLTEYRARLQKLENAEYDSETAGEPFDVSERIHIEVAKRKLQSEMEGVAKKMDMYLCDMQALTKLINESRVVINQQANSDMSSEDGENIHLLVSNKSELQISFEDTSLFQQLNEVCVNATIYESASAVMATPRRSQMIDRMTIFNGIRPIMFDLSEKEQLLLGNQVTDFFFQRLKSWERVNQLISGEVKLEDLTGPERITHDEYSQILSSGNLTGMAYDNTQASSRGSLIDVEVIA